MALPYYPRAGEMLLCDFSDLTEPEMTKIRPVIVVSPKLPFRSEIVTIVPVSTQPPRKELPFVVKLSRNYHPTDHLNPDTWAKCDMLTNVARRRLNQFKIDRRKWYAPKLVESDLLAVRAGILAALGWVKD